MASSTLKGLVACLALASAAGGWVGCGNSDAAPTTGDEDDITSSKCKIFNVRENRPMTPAELKLLNDPVANFVLAGAKGVCPTSFEDTVGKLGQTDTKDCQSGGGPKGPFGPRLPPPGAQFTLKADSANGNSARFVSERSQVLGKPDSYRAVVTRQCNGRTDHELFMSLFGIGAGAASLPADFEAIGKDKTSGVFNFYAREEGQWKFFGSSLDLIGDGYDCNANGACTPKAAAKTRCAGCHVGGGLIMKELNSPWVHWEGDTQTPGVDDLMTKHGAVLGVKGNGIDMESKVSGGNQEYVSKRVAFLKTKGVDELLRPLFCTVDINLKSANGVNFFGLAATMLGQTFGASSGPNLAETDYTALIKQFNQRVVDGRGTQLKGKDGKPVVDTFFKFTFPVRSDLDFRYSLELVNQKLIDEDFSRDVEHVDFTRPVFSKARCDLLAAAPKLAADKITPAAIRDGFKANLAKLNTPAAKQLLDNLNKANDQAAHQKDVDDFLKACTARPAKEMLADIMTYASHLRRAARANVANSGQGIIEFSESMVTDDIPDTSKAFDPTTCTLK